MLVKLSDVGTMVVIISFSNHLTEKRFAQGLHRTDNTMPLIKAYCTHILFMTLMKRQGITDAMSRMRKNYTWVLLTWAGKANFKTELQDKFSFTLVQSQINPFHFKAECFN